MERNSDPPRTVDLARLGQILDAHGADPDAWPETERDDALALLASSAEARALNASAARLDRLLDRAPTLEPSPELKARVLAAAGEAARPWRRRDAWVLAVWPFGPVWRPAVALAVAALLGIAFGTVAPPGLVGSPDPAPLAEEFATLAFGPDVDLEGQP